jgi:hypothetical protein
VALTSWSLGHSTYVLVFHAPHRTLLGVPVGDNWTMEYQKQDPKHVEGLEGLDGPLIYQREYTLPERSISPSNIPS